MSADPCAGAAVCKRHWATRAPCSLLVARAKYIARVFGRSAVHVCRLRGAAKQADVAAAKTQR